MILTCPECSASYNVPTDAIGIDGRQVRCQKCKHVWFQEGEKRALEDLINMIQSTDIEVDDIDFDDGKKKLGKPEAPARKTLKEKLGPVIALPKKLFPQRLKNYLFSGPKRSLLNHFASFMAAFAIFTLFVFLLVSFRWGIASVMPSVAPVYEAAGFPLHDYAALNPEESLTFDRVSLLAESETRQIVGNLINLTSQNIRVPLFKVDFVSSEGVVLHEMKTQIPIHVIEKEMSYRFEIAVPSEIPEDIKAVQISFTE